MTTTETNQGHGSHRELVGYAADVLATRRNPESNVAEILMIRRGKPPCEGCWAFPGGYVDGGETAQEAAAREAGEEIRLPVDPEDLKFVGLYDRPDRDPRGRVVGTAYHLPLLGEAALFEPVPDPTEVQGAAWVSIKGLLAGELGPIAFDHADVIRDLLNSPTGKYLVPAN